MLNSSKKASSDAVKMFAAVQAFMGDQPSKKQPAAHASMPLPCAC